MKEKMLAVVKIALCSGMVAFVIISLGMRGVAAWALFLLCAYAYVSMLWPED